ncbi:hypothetical protein LXL04_028188 [Taraxacum kok-saghyz]
MKSPNFRPSKVALLSSSSNDSNYPLTELLLEEYNNYISNCVTLEGAYFAGVVIRFYEESVSMRRHRPCPPKVDARFTVGDIVDAWYNDGWWSARYIRRDDDNYVVKFDNMDPPKRNWFLSQTSHTLPSRVVGDNKPIKRDR